MKNPITTITVLAIFAALSTAAFTGCEHIGGISAGVTNNNGDLGGNIKIEFRDLSGASNIVNVKPVGRGKRGFDTGGNFVTLNELRSTAVEAYKAGRSGTDAGRAKGYNGFDCDTVAIIVGSLTSYNADPKSL